MANFHGGNLDQAIAEYGGVPSDWLDLSSGINLNPYPTVEIAKSSLNILPDRNSFEEIKFN